MTPRLPTLPLLALIAATSLTHLRAGTPAPSIAAAASEPAVSAINGKLDANYGAINRNSTRGIAGTLSIPVGHDYGLQLDALYQHGFSTNMYGLGGHFFTRDPGKGLLGLAFAGTTSQKFTDAMVGLEGELYLGQFTLGLFAAYDNYNSRVATTFPGLLGQRSFAATRLYMAVYPMDNLMIRLEHQNRFNNNFYMAHVEWQTPLKGVAIYADAGIGANNYAHVLGGVRIYFGGDKTLIARHRQDDPDNFNTAFLGTNSAGSTDTASIPNGGGGGGGGGGGPPP